MEEGEFIWTNPNRHCKRRPDHGERGARASPLTNKLGKGYTGTRMS